MFGIDDLALGAGAGAIGAGVLNYLGTQSTNDANAARADAANQWSAQQYATRYQTMTKDLEAAGLNPMLAYSQSPGSAPTAQQVTFQNPMSAATQGYAQATSANRDVASALQLNEEVNKTKAATAYIEQQTKNLAEEFKNIPLTGQQIQKFVDKMEAERQYLVQKKLSEIEIGNQLRAQIDKLGKETNLLDNQVEVEQSLNNIGRYSKELGPITQLLLNILRSK